MKIIVTKDKITGAAKAFEIFSREIKAGAKVLGLATGSSPIELYQNMTNSDLNFSNLTSIFALLIAALIFKRLRTIPSSCINRSKSSLLNLATL